jgi:hypothetical protein
VTSEEKPSRNPWQVVRPWFVLAIFGLLGYGYVEAECSPKRVEGPLEMFQYECEAFGVPFIRDVPSTASGEPDPAWKFVGYLGHVLFGGIVSLVSFGGWLLQKMPE